MKRKNKNNLLQNYCNKNSVLHGENLQCNSNVANLEAIFSNNVGNSSVHFVVLLFKQQYNFVIFNVLARISIINELYLILTSASVLLVDLQDFHLFYSKIDY